MFGKIDGHYLTETLTLKARNDATLYINFSLIKIKSILLKG